MESTYQSESSFSKEFNKLSHQIGSQIQQMTKNVAQIQRMVGQLGTAQDTDQMRQKLHEIQHYTHTLSQTTMESLKALSALSPSYDADQTRQWKLQKERLTNDFSVVLNNFQAAQRTVAMKEKASVTRARYDTGAVSKDPFESEGDFGAKAKLQLEQTVDLQALHEREKNIRQLESDILDVNQIFKDLALMVHEQGEVVDSIEANVDTAAIHVDRGGSNLRQAADYQRKLRRKRLFCMLFLIVVIIILTLIIYFSTRSNKATS